MKPCFSKVSQKMSFRASKQLRKFKTQKTAKNSKLCYNLKTERTNGGGSNGIGGWPQISTWIIPHPLGRNGPHCIEFLHEMRKLLLNLVPVEPLALVQELASFDNPIQLDLLSVSVFDLHVHDKICGGLFHAVWV